jgi:hypothetical protein
VFFVATRISNGAFNIAESDLQFVGARSQTRDKRSTHLTGVIKYLQPAAL